MGRVGAPGCCCRRRCPGVFCITSNVFCTTSNAFCITSNAFCIKKQKTDEKIYFDFGDQFLKIHQKSHPPGLGAGNAIFKKMTNTFLKKKKTQKSQNPEKTNAPLALIPSGGLSNSNPYYLYPFVGQVFQSLKGPPVLFCGTPLHVASPKTKNRDPRRCTN